MEPIIKIENISKSFGGIKAVDDVSISFYTGKIYCLVGPNGAGKTTLLNLITKDLISEFGKIYFDGLDITALSMEKISQIGIKRTYQQVAYFNQLTCEENLAVGILWENISNFKKILNGDSKKTIENILNKARENLIIYGLKELIGKSINETSYGQKKLIEILRCLFTQPKVVLLDEPLSGFETSYKEQIVELIKDISKKNLTVVIIEHNFKPIFKIADIAFLMNQGRIEVEEKPDNLINNQLAQSLYFQNG
jgi:branched-chain amino acid transport system ATP-binding protein